MKNRVIIIAEAGVNHNGDINIAKELISEASKAGVDYVKFQTFKAEKLTSKQAKKANYQIQNTGHKESQFQMLKSLELSEDDHIEIIEFCKKKNVKFLSTAFDLEGIDFLNDFIDVYKIPSGEITNLPYLRRVALFGKPVFLSTGMATMSEIADALSIIMKYGTTLRDVIVLHCNTEYPTPMNDVNLRAMKAIGSEFNVSVGYSDHTLGIEVPIAAVALGARVIEKHFTLSRKMTGPDHLASLEPSELKSMVSAIRNIEVALGNNLKQPTESEKRNINVARKSIVAAVDINKGEIFTEDNLTTKRPGGGISPMKWDDVIGTRAKKTYLADDLI